MQERFPCVSRNRSLGGGYSVRLLFYIFFYLRQRICKNNYVNLQKVEKRFKIYLTRFLNQLNLKTHL